MFNLFKNKYKPISEYPDTFNLAMVRFDEEIVYVRLREGLKDAAGHTGYPFKIAVAIPVFDGMDEISEKDKNTLVLIEEALTRALEHKNETVFAFALTGKNFKELVYYASEWEPEYFENKVNEIEEKFKPFILQFVMEHDPNWDTYLKFANIN